MESKATKNPLPVFSYICFFMILVILPFQAALAASPVTLTVLNPQAEVKEVPEVPPAARLRSLEGKKIGLINNTKLGAMILQPELEKALQGAFSNVQLKSWVISHVPFEDKSKALKEVARASDGVILFLGD